MEKLLTTDDEIKWVEKRKDGSVRLEYELENSWKAILIFTKKKGTKTVTVNGTSEYIWAKLFWSSKFNNGSIVIKDASNFTDFSTQLWKLLDKLVTTSRKSIPEKAERVYTLLWFDKKTSQVLEELDDAKNNELLAQDELFREEENNLKEEIEQWLQQV